MPPGDDGDQPACVPSPDGLLPQRRHVRRRDGGLHEDHHDHQQRPDEVPLRVPGGESTSRRSANMGARSTPTTRRTKDVGYVGFSQGGTDYAGLPPMTSIEITVPLAFWDSGRIIFSTDGADQFQTYGTTASAAGSVLFRYANTQMTFIGTIAPNSNQLTFTPVYNSFDSNGTTAGGRHEPPVSTGLFKNGEGPGGRGTRDHGHGQFPATQHAHPLGDGAGRRPRRRLAFAGTNCPRRRALLTGDDGPVHPDRLHALPDRLALRTHGQRGRDVVPLPLLAEPQQRRPVPSPSSRSAASSTTPVRPRGRISEPSSAAITTRGRVLDSADYDLVRRRSPAGGAEPPTSVGNTGVQEPFGWVGSGERPSSSRQHDGLRRPDSPGRTPTVDGISRPGLPQLRPTIDPGDVKLPARQNLFLASPLSPSSGTADVFYYKTFPSGPPIRKPLRWAFPTAQADPR